MEGSPDVELEGALSTSLLEQLAGLVDPCDSPRDDELAGAVEVRRYDDLILDAGHDLRDALVGQAEDSSHRTGLQLAGCLHRQRTLGHQAQAILEAQGASSDQSGELTQRVASDHIGLELVAEAERTDDRVEEDGGLRDLGLLQLLVRPVEHDVRDAEAEDLIGLLEEFLR